MHDDAHSTYSDSTYWADGDIRALHVSHAAQILADAKAAEVNSSLEVIPHTISPMLIGVVSRLAPRGIPSIAMLSRLMVLGCYQDIAELLPIDWHWCRSFQTKPEQNTMHSPWRSGFRCHAVCCSDSSGLLLLLSTTHQSVRK